MPHFPSHQQAFFQYDPNSLAHVMHMHMQMYPQYPSEPNYSSVDVDELSASLGLPSARKYTNTNKSPAHSQTSLSSQAPLDPFHSKLLTRAQATPLTADSLARMMQKSGSDSSQETIRAPREPQDPFVVHGSPAEEAIQAMKVVRAPPGFNQKPRMVTVEDEQMLTGPSTPQQNSNIGQSSYTTPRRTSVEQSSTPRQQNMQQHAHQPSSTRRPRPARGKRIDQGPEPSAADIYPEDALWTPTQPVQVHHGYFAPPPYMTPQCQQPNQLLLPGHTSWPTPTEMRTGYEPQQPQVLHHPRPQRLESQHFNISENHVTPSAADLSASDDDILTLLNELPEPKIDTLIHFGTTDLIGEERPNTPMQETGKRYGLQYYGIGYMDEWKAPAVSEGHGWDSPERFRVRPRDHKSQAAWGGWNWAIKNGWGDE